MNKSHQNIINKINIKYENIGELLIEKVSNNPDKIFIICPGRRTDKCTYSEFLSNTLIIAKYLIDSGLKEKDVISIIFNNSSEFLLLYFASLLTGIIVVPINPDLSPLEIQYIVENSKSKQIYYKIDLNDKINIVVNQLKDKIVSVPVKPIIQFDTNQFGDKELDLSTISKIKKHNKAVIIYTSGTTGNPKGVLLSQLNIISDAYSISNWFEFSSKTRTLCILPLYHNNGQITTLIAPLYQGGSTVIVKGESSILAFWDIVQKYNVTWSSVMASILSILLSLKIERKDNTLKAILCGGQVLTSSIQSKFEKRFNVSIYEGYGLTETTSFSCINNYPKNNRISGSIGKPLPTNEMKIIDEVGNECNSNEEGEICIRGLNVAIEYLSMPEKNKFSFRDGWFHSGDYGYKDSKGYYYFNCRKDNLIIKGGENIYPAEIENIIYKNKNVEECAVIGIKDSLLGQNICAFVKLINNNLDSDDIIQFCKNKITSYKLPKKVIIINNLDNLDEIPKGSTKKILYNQLEEYYKKSF
jgi:acyl-CoA synthetase (AMP-forming)/AMP-acid ligase II